MKLGETCDPLISSILSVLPDQIYAAGYAWDVRALS
jgi:hypothetical protein